MAVVNNYEVELLTTQFTSTLEMLLQQMDTRLRGAVRSQQFVGKLASPVQYIASLEFKQAGDRGTDLNPQIVGYQRRWITPRDWDLPVQVDEFDELRTIIDPKSALVASIQTAANRLFDDIIINAFFGTAQLGVDASNLTTETFNSGSDFPISVVIADTTGTGATSSGLNTEKLLEAKRILRRYENDIDGMVIHMAIGAQQEKDLLRQIELMNMDFSGRPGYDGKGQLDTWMGFKFHHSERLLTSTDGNSNTQRRCPVWLEDGMCLGIWKDMRTIISQRNDKAGHPWQAYAMISANATRLQGGKVLELDCLDTATPAGDITP